MLSPFAVSIDDACKLAGVGRSLIYKSIAAGNLQTRKAGRRTLIEVAALQSWLSSLPDGRNRTT